ncbi:MAG: spermidine synthase [Cyanobacteria bacterium SW_9_44_58]|nr:MAG: spermidine synthase [Cyanobacteria bacterium SW_9_44_58]
MTLQQRNLLLLAAAVSSASGLASELLLGTLASYLVGNEALSYGIAVGGFLAAMGMGSYLSRFVGNRGDTLLTAFMTVELLIAPLNAVLPLGLFVLFVFGGQIWLGLSLVTLVLGTLAGLEIPLLTRMVEQEEGVKDALAGVLAMDYFGALVGSLAFPVILMPLVGMFPAAAILGIFPAVMVFFLGRAFSKLRHWRFFGLIIALLLTVFATIVVPFTERLENNIYGAPIIEQTQSSYQRLVLTRQANDVRFFLNGDLQFSTTDEYRYHEALVHPALEAASQPKKVLLLGAGDGLALREVLKWDSVEQATLVELDPKVVEWAKTHPALINANEEAFADPRVEIRYGDAFQLVSQLEDTFDVIIADFPNPDRNVLAKLYSLGFYRQLQAHLAPGGAMVTQASSPFFAPKVFSCIAMTLDEIFQNIYPYRANVPSFGPWGFVLATETPFNPQQSHQIPVKTQFLSPALFSSLFVLPKDMVLEEVEVNTLAHPVIVHYERDRRWLLY